MAATRTSIRSAGKSDAIDALAVARAALREPDLPTAQLDEPTRELKLLVDHREDLVAERTRVQNRLRWHVHELDPELQVPAGAMDQTVWLDQISLRLRRQRRGVSAVLVAMVAELVERVRVLTRQVDQLTRQITVRVQHQAPQLLTLAGCGPLCAAKLLVRPPTCGDSSPTPRSPCMLGGTHSGLVRQAAATSAESWRQPTAECRAAPDRDHPAPRLSTDPGVPAATAHRWEHPRRGGPRPQAAPSAARVSPAPQRPAGPAPPISPRTRHRLTQEQPLSACSLAGRRRGRPGRPRGPMTAGTASTMGSSSCESWVLAADSPTASGSPVASISR
jgi:transposase